jgi:hypothetical protein
MARATAKRVNELEAALQAIMRVTDPGDVRTRLGLQAWENINPARRIAREALGLPLGGRVKVDGVWVDADTVMEESQNG